MKTQATQATSNSKANSDRKWLWIVRALFLAFLVSALATGVVVHIAVRDFTASLTGLGLEQFQPDSGGTGPFGVNETPTAVRFQVTPQPWDGQARVTILVMGIDYRDWLAGEGAPRTDTMMLVTVDPITKQAAMLSIPRDLWVEIPGFGHNRINTAYMFGEASRVPGGGPALAMQTVESVIGVPIQYYAVIDFHTFERVVDEMGGVDVLVLERIRIHPIGQPSVWLEAKPYHLNGAEALAYARVRKGAGDDFGRAARQQQVILALMDRIVALDMLPRLVSSAPELYQELSTGIRTNLSLEEMISLGWLAIQIPKENIQRAVIGPPNMIEFVTRSDGAQVLRPVMDQIRIMRDDVFVLTSALGPTVPETNDEGYQP